MSDDYPQRFADAFHRWLDGCKAIYTAYCDRQGFKHRDDDWRVDTLKRYYRIVHSGGAFAFIDIASGDVLKADSFKRPAKHARGNIFDEHNGLKGMGPHGPAYLR